MPRSTEQNQAIKDKRRARIIKAAIRVFAESGYDNVAVDEITKAADCSHGLFYHYFENKSVILETIVEENIKEGGFLPPCHQAQIEGGIKGIRAILSHIADSYTGTIPHIATGYIAATLSQYESLPKSLKKTAAEYDIRLTLAKLIKQGQAEKKVIAGDPDEIAKGAFYIIESNFRNLLEKGKNASIVSTDVIYNMLLLGERED